MNDDYQLIIFDWEGTLCDCTGAILELLCETATDMGLAPFDRDKARQLLHQDFDLMLRELYHDIEAHDLLSLKAKFRQQTAKNGEKVLLYPGAFAMLKRLHDDNRLLAIATGKGRASLIRALEETKLREYFTTTRSPEQCLVKPAPDMLLDIMDEVGAEKTHTLMVGDNACDIEAAHHAGVDAIGINISGKVDVDGLKALGAKAVVDNYQQLLQQLSRKD